MGRNKATPEGGSNRSFYLSREMQRQLNDHAKANRLKKSEIVKIALEMYFKDKGAK